VLALESTRLDAFAGEDERTMEGIASLIASAFDNLRTFGDAVQSREYLQTILDSAHDVAILSTDLHGYVVTSSAGSELVFRLSKQEILGRDLLTLFSSPPLQREIAVYIGSPGTSPLDRARVSQRDGEIESYLDVTVQRVSDAEGRALGFLCIARDVTENVKLNRTLETLSVTDELTGLFNQRRFFTALEAELGRARRYARRLSLLFIDLDGFKAFNDTRGHLAGDRVLLETGALLRSLVRASIDSCYRYGGDEFTVIMPETTSPSAQLCGDRIRLELARRFEGRITASIGIAESTDGIDARRLVEEADRAMYAAKQQGGDAVRRGGTG
jgi:diguanylate cyclase (GGDEF)-like protein/PAS domain S-box-containing protein